MDAFEEWFYANPERVAWLTKVKADAWDEGKVAGESTDHWYETNPYRQEP
jgi:hypothetical protein